jgi:phage baseplate assembly protein W
MSETPQGTALAVRMPANILAGSATVTPRHLAWPLRLVPGPGGAIYATVDQDTLEEVVQNVHLLLSTQTGERYRDAPDFGLAELVSGDPVDMASAQAAIAAFEPRAAVRITTGRVSGDGTQSVQVSVALIDGSTDASPLLDR